MVKIILKIENFLVFVAALYYYFSINDYSFFEIRNWMIFLLILFAIDLSMIGYLFNKKIGAIIYNLGHSYIFAFLIILYGMIYSIQITSLGLIFYAHIGMDRFLGFGLKYPSGFKDTHIQKV